MRRQDLRKLVALAKRNRSKIPPASRTEVAETVRRQSPQYVVCWNCGADILPVPGDEGPECPYCDYPVNRH